MTKKIQLDDKAKEDLSNTRSYTHKKHGRDQAKKYVERINHALQLISETPNMGTERPEIKKGVRSFKLKHHSIFYEVSNDSVKVHRIPHHSLTTEKELKKSFKSLNWKDNDRISKNKKRIKSRDKENDLERDI